MRHLVHNSKMVLGVQIGDSKNEDTEIRTTR